MKQIHLSILLLLTAAHAQARFSMPFGANIYGAGSTSASCYLKDIFKRYNAIFPCPKFSYKQTPANAFSGTTNGLARVLDRSVTFAILDERLTSASDCLLQIPFIITSLSMIYRLPNDFTITNTGNWPGHLNFPSGGIGNVDLCSLYSGAGVVTWTTVIQHPANGTQTYGGTSGQIRAYALSTSDSSTGTFARFLACDNTNEPFQTCTRYANASNPNGPFCSPSTPSWGALVTCVNNPDEIANQVAAADGLAGRPNGAVGYVPTCVALAHGFLTPTTGPAGGFRLGVAGLYNQITSNGFGDPNYSIPANYVQPTTTSVSAAIVNASCPPGEFICTPGAYPMVFTSNLVLFALQPVDLITCNIVQFIQFALTEGQLVVPNGYVPLPSGCIALSELSQIQSAICDPCIAPCNPCLNQTCPLPCPGPC